MNPPTAKILVAACGNPLAGDDSFGWHVAKLLQADVPAGMKVLYLGTNPAALLDHLSGCRVLMIVDAAHAPDMPPGDLIVSDWDSSSRPPIASDVNLSTHHLSVAGQIELARKLGLLPPVVKLVAVTIRAVHRIVPPSDAILRQVPAAVQAIRQLALNLCRN